MKYSNFGKVGEQICWNCKDCPLKFLDCNLDDLRFKHRTLYEVLEEHKPFNKDIYNQLKARLDKEVKE